MHNAAANMSFRHVGVDVESIIDIEFDSVGIMWLATREGVYRFDGSRLKHISSESGLSDDDIRSLTVDKHDNIWIATNAGGLNVFNPRTGSVKVYRHAQSKQSLSNDSVYDVAFVGDDTAWVSTQNGLNRLDISQGTFTRFFHNSQDPNSPSSNYGYSLFVDDVQRLWLATLGGGVSVYDASTQKFEQIWLSKHTGIKDSDGVFAIRQLGTDRFVFATRSGLFTYDHRQHLLEAVTVSDSFTDTLGTVTDLAQDGDKIFVSTLGQGVFIFDSVTGNLAPASSVALGVRLQLPAVPIYSLALHQSQLFIATLSKGLFSARTNYNDIQAHLMRTDAMGISLTLPAHLHSPKANRCLVVLVPD